MWLGASVAQFVISSATREIVKKGLATRVLVLTMHAEEEYLLPVLEAGAAGYLVKSAADRELGWRPEIKMADGLRDLVAWWRSEKVA